MVKYSNRFHLKTFNLISNVEKQVSTIFQLLEALKEVRAWEERLRGITPYIIYSLVIGYRRFFFNST